MNTEQNYVGRGSYANPPAQTAQNAAQTPFTADNRPELTFLGSQASEAQESILKLVNDFLDSNSATAPISAINDMLFRWLIAQNGDQKACIDLTAIDNQNKLFSALQLVSFITELQEAQNMLKYFTDQIQKEAI